MKDIIYSIWDYANENPRLFMIQTENTRDEFETTKSLWWENGIGTITEVTEEEFDLLAKKVGKNDSDRQSS
ncbi:MAG: hypothetical protein WC476_01280 [Phycisphaerae bacterium]|jgi:hypothetical protein